jgi:hypothetical protein
MEAEDGSDSESAVGTPAPLLNTACVMTMWPGGGALTEARCSSIRVVLPSERLAQMAKHSLEVDEELHPDKLVREYHVEGATLCWYVVCVLRLARAATPPCSVLRAHDVRMLRIGVAGQLDMVGVVARTLREFADQLE